MADSFPRPASSSRTLIRDTSAEEHENVIRKGVFLGANRAAWMWRAGIWRKTRRWYKAVIRPADTERSFTRP